MVEQRDSPFPSTGNPLQNFLQQVTRLTTHLSHVKPPWCSERRSEASAALPNKALQFEAAAPSISVLSQPVGPALSASHSLGHPSGPVSKEDLGRATWTLLHTLAAQYPEKPTKIQRKAVTALVDALTTIYPCAECADHFNDLVRHNPPETSSGAELQQWMCRMHNLVNRSLDKPAFNCMLVDARWGAIDCGPENACDLSIGQNKRRR